MITRSAIFEGVIAPGREEEFFAGVRETLVPLWRQFPDSSNLRVMRMTGADADAPAIVLIQQMDYPSLAAIDRALASPIRTQARAATLALLEMFEGRFYHLVSEDGLVEAIA